MKHTAVLTLSYNRAEYTRLSLENLCRTLPEEADLFIWDNNSNEETKAVVREYENHPRVKKVVYSPENIKLRKPTNWFWEQTKDYSYISKVDDDCLLEDRWIQRLVQAHEDIPKFGIIGCWRFFPEDFQPHLAEKKIKPFGDHKVMRNCWVEGSGYLMKREVVDKLGPLKDKETFTDYCVRAASEGYINGWYYPFISQEHMDDPRAEHTLLKDDDSFKELLPLSAINFKAGNLKAWEKQLKQSAYKLQLFSYNPADFSGIRNKIKRKFAELRGSEWIPKVRDT